MGANVVSYSDAWKAYDALVSDHQVGFASEPPGLEAHWRAITKGRESGPNFWTDSYLAAFAAAGGYTIVSFDRGFRTMLGVDSLILS